MTFRDDHDAALARADALESEVDRLEDEAARLRAENARLAAEAAEASAAAEAAARTSDASTRERVRLVRESDDAGAPASARRRRTRPTPGPRRWQRYGAVAALGALAIVLVVAVVVRHRADRAVHERYAAAVAARTAHVEHWRAITKISSCVRAIERQEAFVRAQGFATYNPQDHRMDASAVVRALAPTCLYGPRVTVEHRRLPADAVAALSRWLSAEAALAPVATAMAEYLGGDYKDDARASQAQTWGEVERALDARRTALAEVRRLVLPVATTAIRDIQRSHDASRGRDHVWWRIEVALAAWDLDDLDRDGAAAGDVVAARARLRQLLATSPIELRRTTRGVADALDRAGSSGQVTAGERSALDAVAFRIDMIEHDDIPGMPVLPPPPPDRDDSFGP